MTSTHCQSVALGRIITPWAVKIAEFFGTIVRIILTIVENIRNTVHELGACCRHARVPNPQPAIPRASSSPSWSRDDAARYVLLADIGRRRRGSPTPPCRRPDAGEKLMDFEAPEAHHTGSEQLL
jgi:hypothetical protein